jgi:outer membrane protein
MRRILLITFVISSVTRATAQQIPEEYIGELFSRNLVLQDKQVSLEKSLIALKEARSLFLPTTWLDGTYTLARGGRSIDIPVGDLLNPVYKTLNQLTNSSNFPTVSNASEQLNPDNFYDLRIKTTMPLINPELKANKAIRQQQVAMQANEVAIYKRELLKDAKVAYYNYLVAGKAVDIYRSALQVVNQNLRVNQSLLANGRGLPAYVSRAESEVKQVENQLLNAENEQANARAYFNFLLNRPLTNPVNGTDADFNEEVINSLSISVSNVDTREELKNIFIAKDINQQTLKMNRAYRVPRLNAFLDLAAQGFDFQVNNKSFFYLGGLQVQVPIFAGNRNLYKISRTELDGKSLQLNSTLLREQLELSVMVSRNNINTAYSRYQSAKKQEEAATRYFHLIDKGFREGVNSFIEFLDARNQLTNAQIQVNISKYKVLASLADYERQTASYSLK